MYKSQKGMIAAVTGVIVSILIGMLFTKKKDVLKKLARKGKDKLKEGKEKFEKGKEEVTEYADQMHAKAKNNKKQLKPARG